MVIRNEEARKTIVIRLSPSIARSRLRAASSDKRLEEWIEDTMDEKIGREQERVK